MKVISIILVEALPKMDEMGLTCKMTSVCSMVSDKRIINVYVVLLALVLSLLSIMSLFQPTGHFSSGQCTKWYVIIL